MQGSLEKKTKTYWHQPRAQDGSNLAPRYSVKLTLKSQQTCNITRVQHKSICLSFTVQCLPMSGLGLWRNRWPNYIDPQNLFTALRLFKEQLIMTYTKNTLLLSGTVRESKETRCSLTRVRSTAELKAQRSTVSLQPAAYLHYFTFLWKKSHYRTTDCTWNFFLRGSLKAKAKVSRSGFIFDNIPLCVISQLRSYTLPCPSLPNKGQNPTGGFVHTDNFWAQFLPEIRFDWILTTPRATKLSQLTFTQKI